MVAHPQGLGGLGQVFFDIMDLGLGFLQEVHGRDGRKVLLSMDRDALNSLRHSSFAWASWGKRARAPWLLFILSMVPIVHG